MKYTFSLDEDVVSLKYKDKEFNFNINVKLIGEMQGLVMEARKRMIQELAKTGQSIKNLTIEKKEDGKTYFDNSNQLELEQIYQEEVMMEFFNRICSDFSGMNLTDLMLDIGLETEDEGAKFSNDLIAYMSGNIPSRKSTK